MKVVVKSFDAVGNSVEILLDSKDAVISMLLDDNERELIHDAEPNKIVTFFPNRSEFKDLENRTKIHESLVKRIRSYVDANKEIADALEVINDKQYAILIKETTDEIDVTVDANGMLFTVSELLAHLQSKYGNKFTIMITNPFTDDGLYSELREKAGKDILVIYNTGDSPK